MEAWAEAGPAVGIVLGVILKGNAIKNIIIKKKRVNQKVKLSF